MAKYGVNYYGSSNYGSFVNLRFSVQPMSILATDLETVSSFAKVLVKWQTPRGNFTRIRLVRNQAGFPETAEDGVVIYDELATEGTVSRTSIIDGEENPTDIPLVPGRQVYYRMFLFTETLVWKVAGSITAIVPSDHGIQDKFMATLPRVFTSKSQEPLGAVDADSDLYKFMSGLTFAQEELYTLIDLLKPRHTGLETPFELIPTEVTNYGLLSESALPIKNQKRLIREALYMYTHKGTENGIERYAESLTGYAPTITVSENLLLTVQDSTFYGGTGNWIVSNAVLTSSLEQVPDSNTNQIDTTKTGKVVASAAGSMALGYANPTSKTVTGLQRDGGTTVLQVAVADHGYSVGQTVTLSGLSEDFNGTYTITTVPASNQFNVTTVATTSYNASALNGSVIAAVGGGNVITQGVPVLPNTEYIVSCKLKSPASAGNITISVTFYDKDGQPTSAAKSSTSVAANNTWKSASKTATSDADSSYAGIAIDYSAAGTYYIDQVCMQTGDTVVYDEARAVDIFLDPSKTNYINNPSFEVDDSSWTITADDVTLLEEDIPDSESSGEYSVKVDNTSGATFETETDVEILNRDTYATVSFYAKSSVNNLGATITLTALDNLDSGEIEGIEEVELSTDWARYTATIYINDTDIPAAPTGELYFRVNIETDADAGSEVWLDDVQLELTQKATDFFDGNLPSEYGAVWQGTENDSPTRLYTNKNKKIPRLYKTLNDWVPQNTFWRIRSYDGLEATNLTV